MGPGTGDTAALGGGDDDEDDDADIGSKQLLAPGTVSSYRVARPPAGPRRARRGEDGFCLLELDALCLSIVRV